MIIFFSRNKGLKILNFFKCTLRLILVVKLQYFSLNFTLSGVCLIRNIYWILKDIGKIFITRVVGHKKIELLCISAIKYYYEQLGHSLYGQMPLIDEFFLKLLNEAKKNFFSTSKHRNGTHSKAFVQYFRVRNF